MTSKKSLAEMIAKAAKEQHSRLEKDLFEEDVDFTTVVATTVVNNGAKGE